MVTNNLAVIGYGSQMVAFAVLAVLFLGRQAVSSTFRYLAMASLGSSMSGGLLILQSLAILPFGAIVVAAQWLSSALWIIALFSVLRTLDDRRLAEDYARRIVLPSFAVACAALAFYSGTKFDSIALALAVSGGVVLGVMLISLVEQIYRNLPTDSISSLKYVCLALLLVGVYDIVLFLRAVSTGAIAADFWAARGYVNALVVVPLALSAVRADFETDADIPRQVEYYKLSILVIGASIVLWLVSDSYIGGIDGLWSNVAGIVLGGAALCAIGVLFVSATIRARVRVSLTKVFFRYRYDYRKEWLRFISTLSKSGLENVPATVVRAVGQIVNSPGGIVWLQEREGSAYAPVGSWHCEIPATAAIDSESGLVRFLNERQWVIDLEEKQRYPARYDVLELDAFFYDSDDWWLIVPLFLGKRLLGFICLRKPRVIRSLNFEDHDLLRTVGRHVATHINQAESDKRLVESRQFGTYNRLTAFLMHDLNNLIAQQSLVVTNAERFRNNPKFVDDAIDTIANSVSRMKRLMEQLTRGSKTPAKVRTDLREALSVAADHSAALCPIPTLIAAHAAIYVMADPVRLTTVFEHLIRNAQDATDDHGRIELDANVSNDSALVTITDNGEGMSAEFIRERLFRPFDSTKGSHAMGIGAYQAREYARMLGGQLDVKSEQGVGTTFTLRLPVTN